MYKVTPKGEQVYRYSLDDDIIRVIKEVKKNPEIMNQDNSYGFEFWSNFKKAEKLGYIKYLEGSDFRLRVFSN